MNIPCFDVQPLSLVSRNGLQCIAVTCRASQALHGALYALGEEDGVLLGRAEVSLPSGKSQVRVMLPPAAQERQVRWELRDGAGEVLARCVKPWPVPRQWKLYVMISSHTDIGLHNSPYIQRYNSEVFVDAAMGLCDETEGRAPENQYRYIMEGKWFWENYEKDRGAVSAQEVVSRYIQPGKLGVCAGLAGNHTQTFGLEEMCRSAYTRRQLKERWGIACKTLSMIDNNGLTWAMIQPYVQAGYENILFAPNQWNPRFSTIWPCDTQVMSYTWNPEAGGGGSRIDFRFGSQLPQVFFWESPDKASRLLFWGGGNYPSGMSVFGLYPTFEPNANTLRQMEEAMGRQLPAMEEKYPYDLWFCACYRDDQAPDLRLIDCMTQWNEKWLWPRFEAVGDPDLPFRQLRQRFEKSIPVVRGDITGGWYQHPLSAAQVLADKFAVDRLLPTAEKLATLAGIVDAGYGYPAVWFDRAWEALLCNDEHSYGTSGYQGQRVYETWMQHRAWIEEAGEIARQEGAKALACIGAQVAVGEDCALAFNPTLQERTEWIASPWNPAEYALVSLPALGYQTVAKTAFAGLNPKKTLLRQPPAIENAFYRLRFSEDGSLASIFDKALQAELVDQGQEYGANCFLYTQDNHKSYHRPQAQRFEVESNQAFISVTAHLLEPFSQADITQTVKLWHGEKRIDVENRLEHVRDMFNSCRYDRYAYYAFPFQVEHAQRLCHLNGCTAVYGQDVTGHGTDVYMAAHEWCCVKNQQMGVGLIQLDSQLIEFDHIHPDKTDFGRVGDGSAVYSYLANDWLQMHVSGGDELNFRFRYAMTSFKASDEGVLAPMAERYGHAPVIMPLSRHAGTLPSRKSFLQGNARLLTLKRAQDGQGIIARLYGEKALAAGELAAQIEWNTVDEEPLDEPPAAGFQTLRLGRARYRLAEREEKSVSQPLEIGASYTGLIQRPHACCGETPDRMYLVWGHAEKAARYAVYREGKLIATVERGDYCVGRYTDENLEAYTTYRYQVCALDEAGNQGPLSEAFSGKTRQDLEKIQA